jgi:hypothetical protein
MATAQGPSAAIDTSRHVQLSCILPRKHADDDEHDKKLCGFPHHSRDLARPAFPMRKKLHSRFQPCSHSLPYGEQTAQCLTFELAFRSLTYTIRKQERTHKALGYNLPYIGRQLRAMVSKTGNLDAYLTYTHMACLTYNMDDCSENGKMVCSRGCGAVVDVHAQEWLRVCHRRHDCAKVQHLTATCFEI